MRPSHNTTTTATAAVAKTGVQGWHSPIPYLLGGLALMFGLITVALVILACSYNKSSSNSSSSNAEEKPAKPVHVLQPEMEPKIVVIMAGDDNPTYLAKPVLATHHNEEV